MGFAGCFSFYELIKQDGLVILIVVALDLMQSLGRLGESLTLLAVPWGSYPGPEVSFYGISQHQLDGQCMPPASTNIADTF